MHCLLYSKLNDASLKCEYLIIDTNGKYFTNRYGLSFNVDGCTYPNNIADNNMIYFGIVKGDGSGASKCKVRAIAKHKNYSYLIYIEASGYFLYIKA